MEKIILNSIIISHNKKNRIEYDYSVPDKMDSLFRGEKLFIELPKEIDANTIPLGILAVPFCGIMLTAAMLVNVSIYVPVLDETFYSAIKEIKDAFDFLYPKADLFFDVEAGKVESYKQEVHDSSIFFTGGVDATCALISKISEKPLFINIVDRSSYSNDNKTQENLKLYFDSLKNRMGISYEFIHTNARAMFNEGNLNSICHSKHLYHGWWIAIAHILSMTTSIVPFLWVNKIKKHYVGSANEITSKDYDTNHPRIVQAIKFGSCEFELVNYELNRNEKVNKIVDYCKENNARFNLHVCWYAKNGVNCSNCEKCYRTIMNLILNDADPNEYGFYTDDETFLKMRQLLSNGYIFPGSWKPIISAYKKNKNKWKNDSRVSWILHFRLNNPKVLFRIFIRKAKYYISKIQQRLSS